MTGEPLSLARAHVAVMVPSPAVRRGAPGRPGTPEIVMVFEAFEGSESPSLLTATTVKE